METLKTQEYLRQHNLESLKADFAIKVNRHREYPNLVHLQYDQISSPMGQDVVRECRGLILDESRDWKVICNPYRKFFNYGEGHAAQIGWGSARVFEKLDGSAIFVWHYDGRWHASTTGTPDGGGSMGSASQETFADCFWRIWSEKQYKMPVAFGPPNSGETYIFEFMTPWNQVVVRHESPRIVLTGYRAPDGTERGVDWAKTFFNWEVVNDFPLTSIEGVLQACEALNPLEHEGYVVCDAWFNRVKVKSPRYVALHHLRDSFSTSRLVELIRKGEGSEFLNYFPEFQEEYSRINGLYLDLVERCNEDFERFRHIPTVEEFAQAVKDLPHKPCLFVLYRGKNSSPEEFFAQITIQAVMRALGLKESAAELVEA